MTGRNHPGVKAEEVVQAFCEDRNTNICVSDIIDTQVRKKFSNSNGNLKERLNTRNEKPKEKLPKCFWNKRPVRDPVTTEPCALPDPSIFQQSLAAVRIREEGGTARGTRAQGGHECS
jgi:hypothetical protein